MFAFEPRPAASVIDPLRTFRQPAAGFLLRRRRLLALPPFASGVRRRCFNSPKADIYNLFNRPAKSWGIGVGVVLSHVRSDAAPLEAGFAPLNMAVLVALRHCWRWV